MTNDAYAARNRLMVLAATLALYIGLRAGRYRDPEESEERFAWVVQIDLPTGQVTMHIDAEDTASQWQLLPEISRTWDGHVAQDAFAAIARFVEARLDDIRQGLGLRALYMAALNRVSGVEDGAWRMAADLMATLNRVSALEYALSQLQSIAADLKQERQNATGLEAAPLGQQFRVLVIPGTGGEHACIGRFLAGSTNELWISMDDPLPIDTKVLLRYQPPEAVGVVCVVAEVIDWRSAGAYLRIVRDAFKHKTGPL